jgi:hypothetical protein
MEFDDRRGQKGRAECFPRLLDTVEPLQVPLDQGNTATS